jgi:hypothetical protein
MLSFIVIGTILDNTRNAVSKITCKILFFFAEYYKPVVVSNFFTLREGKNCNKTLTC